jgi:hypothetical protein
MAKIHPAVGHFLGAAKELDIFDEALALITKGSKSGKSKGQGKMDEARRAKISRALKASWKKKKAGK